LHEISNPDYKNRVKKAAAVESLAEQFNTSAIEINRKLHNLRTQFDNKLRKLAKAQMKITQALGNTSQVCNF